MLKTLLKDVRLAINSEKSRQHPRSRVSDLFLKCHFSPEKTEQQPVRLMATTHNTLMILKSKVSFFFASIIIKYILDKEFAWKIQDFKINEFVNLSCFAEQCVFFGLGCVTGQQAVLRPRSDRLMEASRTPAIIIRVASAWKFRGGSLQTWESHRKYNVFT